MVFFWSKTHLLFHRRTHCLSIGPIGIDWAGFVTSLHVDPAHLSRCSSMNYTRPAITRKYSRGFNLYTDDSSLEPRFLTGSVPYYKKTDEPLVPKPVRCDPLSPRPDNVDRVYHYHTSLRRVPICVGVDLTSWLDRVTLFSASDRSLIVTCAA